jgi:hypothetical protein
MASVLANIHGKENYLKAQAFPTDEKTTNGFKVFLVLLGRGIVRIVLFYAKFQSLTGRLQLWKDFSKSSF